MYVGCKNHKTESLRKLFSSISKGLFVCILLAGCAERPPSAINPENTPPSVTIISPAKADILQVPAQSPKNKADKKPSEADLNLAERKGIDLKSKHLTNLKKKTTEKEVVSKKADRGTSSKSSGIYKKGTGLVFQGLAVDVEGGSISESSLRWTSDKEGEIGKGYSFTKSDLSAGEHQIVLTATDSEGGVGRDTVNVTIEAQTEVLGNKLPIVKILSLEEGWSLLNTTELILRGIAEDPEDGKLEGESLVWKSDRHDGALGWGSPLDVTDKLSLGDHTITLMATDSDGNTGEVSVDISITDKIDDTINNSPIANILSIADETSLDGVLNILSNAKLILEGTAEDVEDGTLGNGSLEWSSDVDGVLGTGSSLDITGRLSLGEHVITLTATDKKGAEGYDNATIQINNVPPVADILSLEEGMSLLESADLILDGAAEDFEDDILASESLVWSSNIDGELGTGGKLDATGLLSTGNHTITLTATDSEGATGSDEVSITVNLAPPTNVTAEAINSTTVQLSWQDNSDNETYYNIEKSLSGTGFELAARTEENVTRVKVTGLDPETLYEFRIFAENSAGEQSDYSNLVEIETLPAKIIHSVSADNTLDSSTSDGNISDGTLPVGALLDESRYRAALAFADLQNDISGRTIEKAVLRLYSASLLDVQVELNLAVNAFIESWEPDIITWNDHLEKYTSDGQSEQKMALNVDEQIDFDITPIARNWAAGKWDVNGLLVRSTSGLLDVTAEFESLETGGSEGLEPIIIIDFGD